MMNCEEYREAIAADPSFDGGAGHVTECAACQAYRNEMLALNATIARALVLDAPDLVMPELPDIETDKVVPLAHRRRVTPPLWLAMAATVVIAAFLGVRFIGGGVEYESLADEVLAHLDHEPYALRVSDEPVSDRRLSSVVASDVAQMDHSGGLITYAQTCVINGRRVPHLVIQGERGPGTIVLMPDEMISAAMPRRDEVFEGAILPVGNGSIAIIGEHEEDLAKIEEAVVNSVMRST